MHISPEEALDLIELKMADCERQSWYDHIGSCADCAFEFQEWSRFANSVKRTHLLSAPDPIVASAKRICETRFKTPEPRPLLRQVVALIVFDSFAEPAPAGIRAGLWMDSQVVSRRVLLQTDDFDIHVRISKVEDHRELFGQILPRDGGFVKDASVHLKNEEERIGSAELNSLGEFLFTRIPDGLVSLQIDLPYVTVISALRTTY